jgi:nitrogen regulation protein NR(I)
MAKILVVDDEEKICFAFEQFLSQKGYQTFVASNGPDALEIVAGQAPDIVFLDVCLPGVNGLEILEEIKRRDVNCAVVVMTAYSSMDTTIKAIQMGAYEYLTKPIDLDQIETIIANILRRREVTALPKVEKLSGRLEHEPNEIIGNSAVMQGIFKMIGLLTTNDVTVLIEGESGVGKELVAQAIHYKGGRRNRPFVAVNCGAMPASLLESELFGHEKGAFTGADSRKIGKFEYAAEGTIFLDEIGDLELPLQIKLLRVLQEKQLVRVGGLEWIPVRARVITATNKNLYEEVKAGNFRSDLYYRLQLITLRVPPLRERKEDIPVLIEHFISRSNRELGKAVRGVESSALDRLTAYDWPGNVRELGNVVKRAAILTKGDTLGIDSLEFSERSGETEETYFDLGQVEKRTREWFKKGLKSGKHEQPSDLYRGIMSAVEKTLIQEALQMYGGNQVKASSFLGMNRATLRKKMEEYHLK